MPQQNHLSHQSTLPQHLSCTIGCILKFKFSNKQKLYKSCCCCPNLVTCWGHTPAGCYQTLKSGFFATFVRINYPCFVKIAKWVLFTKLSMDFSNVSLKELWLYITQKIVHRLYIKFRMFISDGHEDDLEISIKVSIRYHKKRLIIS